MKQMFNFLYQIHPWLPIAYLVHFVVGLLGLAVYCAVKKAALFDRNHLAKCQR